MLSCDLLIAFLIMCLMVYLILFSINESIELNREFSEKFSVQRKGIFLLDSLIKNSDQNNPLMGSAYFDPEKKRVEPNVIDYQLLKKVKAATVELGEGLFIQELFIRFKSGSKEILFSNSMNGDCLSFERFVLIKKALAEEKAEIGLVLCHA